MSIAKTEKGHQVLKDRSVALSQHQRSVLIMFDGKRSMDAVLKATGSLGVTRAEVDELIALGLLAGADADSAAPTAPTTTTTTTPITDSAAPQALPAPSELPERSDMQRYQEAYLLATQLTANLGLRGFRLNLAVEAAGGYQELLALSPRIKEAVGAEKFAPLDRALRG